MSKASGKINAANALSADPAASPVPAPKYEPKPQERAAVEAWFDRRRQRAPAPRLKVEKKGPASQVALDHPHPETGSILLMAAVGTSPTRVGPSARRVCVTVPRSRRASMANESKGESSPDRRCRPGRVGSAAEAKMDALEHLRALGGKVRRGRGYPRRAMCPRRRPHHEIQALSAAWAAAPDKGSGAGSRRNALRNTWTASGANTTTLQFVGLRIRKTLRSLIPSCRAI